MADTKFTPGPWELVSLSGYGNPFSVRMPYIADRAKPDQTYYGVQSIRRREDAHLIATAPELYESLEDVLGLIPLEFEESPMVAFAKAALAKARGEVV
ncbi:hypothetical protein [Brucella pituitosa]